MYFPVVLICLVSTVRCANILGIFMFPSPNHQSVFQPIWKELSLRGHQVTVVTPDPIKDPTLTNLKEINVHFAYDVLKKHNFHTLVSSDVNKYDAMKNRYKILDALAERELNSTQVRSVIWNNDQKFDLILIDDAHPVMYAFVDKFKAPYILLSSMEPNSATYDAVGNPSHPVLYPEVILNFSPGQLSLWQKLQSTYFFVWNKYYYHNVVVPRAHEIAKKYFGQDIPYIGEIERQVSMYLVNTNRLLHPPRPNVPAVVEIGPVNNEAPKSLPKDLQKILDEAKEGVIYVDLACNLKSTQKLRQKILLGLSELPYKVLWKCDSDYLPGKPSNVVIRKRLPQRDVLAHPNIKAFVTEGTLQSIEEAVSREVPLLGVPFMADQPSNVRRIKELGIGKGINPGSLTKIKFKDALIKVAETKSYKRQLREARDILFDRPMTGLETAVWWSEYVIRHKGAQHLRCPAADMSWFEYLLLDVILVLIVGALVAFYATKKLLKALNNMCKRKTEKPKQN